MKPMQKKPQPSKDTVKAVSGLKLDVAALALAVQQVGRLTGTATINMKLDGGLLRVGGENAGRSFVSVLDFPSKASWEFSVPKVMLEQTLRGRKDLTMSVEDGRLYFKARSFQAEFATEPFEAGPELYKSGDVLKVKASQQRRLLAAMKMVFMTSTLSADTLFCVDMDSERTHIACLDKMSAAFLSDEGVATPMKFALPSSSFKTLLETAGAVDYKISTSGAALCAWSDNWEIILPFVQGEHEFDLPQAYKMVTGLGKSFAKCRAAELALAVETANTVLDVGGDILVTVNKGSLSVSGSSSMGTVTESIEANMLLKSVEPFKIDAASAINLLNLAPGEIVEIGTDNNAFFIRAVDETTQATYITALRH